jgi:hypothetical protein
MSLSALASVFAGANQTGTSAVYGVGTAERYHRISADELISRGLHMAISSCTVFGSSSADPALIFFGMPGLPSFLDIPDYNGMFVQRTNLGSAEQNVNLATHGFNDVPRSALLVATNRSFEVRLSFRDLFLAKWKETLDGVLSDGAQRKGDPTLTWEMFPWGISHLQVDRMYLRIRQDLHIEIDWWPDYEAWIQYHIFLFINSAGNPRGAVHRWEYWIEGGAKSDDIEEKLKPAVIDGMDTLNAELTKTLSGFDGFNLNDLYYLPGRQLAASSVATGFTTDDVTIVIEI